MTKYSHQLPPRSSAAEYLTFIAATGEARSSFEIRYQDENIWLTQKMMAVLYEVATPTVNYHLKKVFRDLELDRAATVRKFLIVQSEGRRQVEREVEHYGLEAVIAVGFKVNSGRAVQFRKWVNRIAKDYTIKGWVMDKERLMNGGTTLTREYFDRLLEEIREIRLSERIFYQKITDIYATALDYDPQSKATRDFFAQVQNKMHYAVHGRTAAELVHERADAGRRHMGLTTWKNAPQGKIHKFDVSVAKNYLTRDELASLGRIVNAYLDLAEDRAKRGIPMTMADWGQRLDIFLQADDRAVLADGGKISATVAQARAEGEFEKFRVLQDDQFKSDFDRFLEETPKISKRPPRPD